MTLRKIMTISTMTAALYANTNLDSEENSGMRQRMIDEMNENIEARFASTVALIYGAKDPNAVEQVDMDDPFFAAMRVPDTVISEIKGE